MQQRVTAIVVAHSGAAHLQRTLEGLAFQTRRPDAVVVIGVGSNAATAQFIASARPTQYLTTSERLSFPEALAAASRALQAPVDDDALLWLLAQDSAPEPTALQELIAVLEVSPSVAVAGPKLVEWDDRSRIREFGVAMTRFGAAVPVVENELDQAQNDDISDVLGVSAVGMLVRHSVWLQLGGLDAGLPEVDAGLDFSVRARLAGHRVVLAPEARVALGDTGIAVPRRFGRLGGSRRLVGARRAAQLHRRMVYAPAAALVWHWLSLVPFAVARSIVHLLAKQPGAIGGELTAAFGTAFGGGHVGRARRILNRSRVVGWSAIAPLRIPQREVRRRRALDRELLLAAARGERRELDFFGGGAWVIVGAVVASLAAFSALLGAGAIGGGGLLPLSRISMLWNDVGYGWREIGSGFVGAADPFTAVLAVLGTVTFWQPSLSLVLLWFAAMPLAALGAWMLAARFTARQGARAVFAIAWAVAPPLLAGLQSGRPAAVIAHILLPWLIYAAWNAKRSWASSAVASITAAGLLACAPSLVPALAIAWLIWVATSGRDLTRTIGVPIPTIVLFLPLAVGDIAAGNPLAVFADPGLPQGSPTPAVWQLLLGYPGGAASGDPLGWQQLIGTSGLGGSSSLIAAALLVPIGLLALVGLFGPRSVRAGLMVLGGLLGLGTAVAAAGTGLAVSGGQSVLLWTGPALSLWWLGVTAAATVGLSTIRKGALAPSWIAVVALLAAVAPLGAAMPLGTSLVSAGASNALPAFVAAQAAQHPRVATVMITPDAAGGIAAALVRGTGATLDAQSTLASTTTAIGPSDRSLATLAANLVTPSGLDPRPLLARDGIGFVFVSLPAGADESQQSTAAAAAVALDGSQRFSQVGATATGTLWSTTFPTSASAAPALGSQAAWVRGLDRVGLLVVFAIALLLALPTGRLAEAERRARRGGTRAGARVPASSGDEDATDEEGEAAGFPPSGTPRHVAVAAPETVVPASPAAIDEPEPASEPVEPAVVDVAVDAVEPPYDDPDDTVLVRAGSAYDGAGEVDDTLLSRGDRVREGF